MFEQRRRPCKWARRSARSRPQALLVKWPLPTSAHLDTRSSRRSPGLSPRPLQPSKSPAPNRQSHQARPLRDYLDTWSRRCRFPSSRLVLQEQAPFPRSSGLHVSETIDPDRQRSLASLAPSPWPVRVPNHNGFLLISTRRYRVAAYLLLRGFTRT